MYPDIALRSACKVLLSIPPASEHQFSPLNNRVPRPKRVGEDMTLDTSAKSDNGSGSRI
jgi:hypothetical protein